MHLQLAIASPITTVVIGDSFWYRLAASKE
jgi:hypothetical protein